MSFSAWQTINLIQLHYCMTRTQREMYFDGETLEDKVTDVDKKFYHSEEQQHILLYQSPYPNMSMYVCTPACEWGHPYLEMWVDDIAGLSSVTLPCRFQSLTPDIMLGSKSLRLLSHLTSPNLSISHVGNCTLWYLNFICKMGIKAKTLESGLDGPSL